MLNSLAKVGARISLARFKTLAGIESVPVAFFIFREEQSPLWSKPSLRWSLWSNIHRRKDIFFGGAKKKVGKFNIL